MALNPGACSKDGKIRQDLENMPLEQDEIWWSMMKYDETYCFRPLPPLVLLSPPSDHAPVELGGKDTHLKWCWTVSKDSDSPHHFEVDLFFWDKFDTLAQKQPMVRNCSKLLPAKSPFQELGKSCKDLLAKMFDLSTKKWNQLPKNEINSSPLSKFFKFLDLVLLVPALDHAPVEVGGKDIPRKWCWTVTRDSDNPRHFEADLSFWVTFETLVPKKT
jgi:hypothetical protein